MRTFCGACVLASLLAFGMACAQQPSTGTTKKIDSAELAKLLEKPENIFFLDVREPSEIARLGSVKGYVNIPMSQLETRLNEVPKDKVIVTLWNQGGRAARAAAILEAKGFKTLGSCGLEDYKKKNEKELVYPKQKG